MPILELRDSGNTIQNQIDRADLLAHWTMLHAVV